MSLTGCLCRCFNANNRLSNTGVLRNHVRLLKNSARRNCWPRKKLPDDGDPQKLLHVEIENKGFRTLVAPLGFTLLVGGTSFTGAVIWQYETLRAKAVAAAHNGLGAQRRFFGKAGDFRNQLNDYWNRLSDGQKVTYGIVGVNIAVFLFWKISSFGALQSAMHRYFLSSPFTGARCKSMLLSTFSHMSFIHLFLNMYVLMSFSPAISKLMGKEQYLGFFCTAGVVSSLTSYAFKVAKFSLTPSLGASGAIMGVLGYYGMMNPNGRVAIAGVNEIIPHSFTIQNAMVGMIALDALGILRGWAVLDHAAHLGGMLFGIWYAKYGQKMFWGRREPLMRYWHNFRGNP